VVAPTAKQTFAAGHATALRALRAPNLLPGTERAGANWTDQRLPSKRSISGLLTPREDRGTYLPTATQAREDLQLTPVSTAWPGGRIDCIVHREPFQCSAIGRLSHEPTASQLRVDTHETPWRPLFFGTGTLDQLAA
jgi:hypothetical protein